MLVQNCAWAASPPSFWSGFSPMANFQGEIDSNFMGGVARGSTGTAYFQGGISWSSDRAHAWSGGRFVATYLAIDTGQPDHYVGDIQGISGLTAPYDLSEIHKLYYRQGTRLLTMRAGLMNANDYFDDIGVAADLFNASYGAIPTWSQNLEGSSNYPFSSLGAMVALRHGDTTIQGGVFGGDAEQPWQQPFARGSFSLVELDHSGTLNGDRYGVKIGAFRNQQRADLASRLGPDTTGVYGIGEYRWNTQALHWGTFLVGGLASNPINPVPSYVGTGVKLAGYLPHAPKDVLSFGISRASLQGQPYAETSYELTSTFYVVRGVRIQPDLQVVLHPGGYLPTALVGALRITINFITSRR